METPASFKKHPSHPILVALPIGLWIFSLVADVIYTLGWGPEVWNSVAFYTLAGGIVGGLIAAVPGLVDLVSLTDPELKHTGITHMFVMLISVVIFAADFWLRWKGENGRLPFILSIVGVIGIFVGGWIGGDLVHVHRVSVAEPRGQ